MTSADPTVELRNFPLGIKYFVEEYDYCYRIQVSFKCKDRENGDPIELFLYYSYSKDQYTKVDAIRTALIESLTHEIDECLFVDGDRIFDPHDPEKLHA